MAHLIDKDALVAEIKRLLAFYSKEIEDNKENPWAMDIAKRDILQEILSFIDTLEVKEVDIWHLQEKEDIYDAVKDWSLHTFVCIMKDGTIQKFTGNLDEDYNGHINIHIDGVNDDYDNVDDIIKWIEFT